VKIHHLMDGFELTVKRPSPDDAAAHIAQIDSESFTSLAIESGDIISIEGKSVTAAKGGCDPRQETEGGTIRLDSRTRQNAGVGLDETVTIRPVTEVANAKRLVLAPPKNFPVNTDEESIEAIRSQLLEQPLRIGDVVHIQSSDDHPFALPGKLPLVVAETVPESTVQVTEATTVDCRPVPVELAATKTPAYTPSFTEIENSEGRTVVTDGRPILQTESAIQSRLSAAERTLVANQLRDLAEQIDPEISQERNEDSETLGGALGAVHTYDSKQETWSVLDPEQQSSYHDVFESVGEYFQNHPLDLVNEDMLHPRLVSELKKAVSTPYLPARLNTDWREWGTKWKMELWDEMEGDEFGKAARVRTEVCFQDPTGGTDQEKNYFDIAIFDDEQELEFLSKSRGPANWFSVENDVELLAEVKHSKTSDEKDFFDDEKGAKDIRKLSKFSQSDIERVFIFANHYPINHYREQNRSSDWWKNLTDNLDPEEFEAAVTVYYVPRTYSTNSQLSVEKKVIKKTEGKIKLETVD
jgi:hypothetical protein